MLRSLEIRDILLIDRLDLAFEPGLTVLTGETGAGKSILLDALGLALGWRGRADAARPGSDRGEVVAVFDLSADHPAHEVLEGAGLPAGDELILRRVAGGDGRMRAWVNDRRASGEVLRALSARLVELHGQRDDRGLLDQRAHRRLLDAFGGLGEARARVGAAWEGWREAAAALAAAEAALAAAREEEEFLRHAVAELGDLAPETGEDDALDARRRAMQAAERVGADIARAREALGADGAEGRMGDALRWLEGAAEGAQGQLDAPLEALERALVELGEATAGVEAALEALRFDPGDLEHVEERLFALRALARKHRVSPDDLPGLEQSLRARLETIEAGEGTIAARREALSDAEACYRDAAATLAAGRRAAAERLDARLARELPPLKLESARFATGIAPAEPGPEGTESVRFAVSTAPDLAPGPIERVASGGELARLMLALKVCLADSAQGRTMIFDEIDRGLGGATAEAVGTRLARLAAGGGQVLAVTHSPQVAAQAGQHFHVEKIEAGGATTARVTRLDQSARLDEIARMLAGARITPAAREAARALMEAPAAETGRG